MCVIFASTVEAAITALFRVGSASALTGCGASAPYLPLDPFEPLLRAPLFQQASQRLRAKQQPSGPLLPRSRATRLLELRRRIP